MSSHTFDYHIHNGFDSEMMTKQIYNTSKILCLVIFLYYPNNGVMQYLCWAPLNIKLGCILNKPLNKSKHYFLFVI